MSQSIRQEIRRMVTEFRVVGGTQTGAFGPTKRRDIADHLCASRVERYPSLGPWRVQQRTISEWVDLTGTLWEEA